MRVTTLGDTSENQLVNQRRYEHFDVHLLVTLDKLPSQGLHCFLEKQPERLVARIHSHGSIVQKSSSSHQGFHSGSDERLVARSGRRQRRLITPPGGDLLLQSYSCVL